MLPPFENFTADPLAVYVGNISPEIEARVFHTIVARCGGVKNWNQQIDSLTGKSQGFGFCHCTHPESALRLERVMNGMKVKGRSLVVKILSRTKRTAENYAKLLNEEHLASRKKDDEKALDAVKKALGPLLDSSNPDRDDVNGDLEKFHERQSLVEIESTQDNRKYLKRVLDDMIREDEKIKRQKRAEILGLNDDENNKNNDESSNNESVFQTQQFGTDWTFSSSSKSSKSNHRMDKATSEVAAVFAKNNQDDNISEQKVDELGRVIREVVPLEYTEDEKQSTTSKSVKEQAAAIAKRFKLEQKLKSMSAKQLYAIPIDWESVETLKLLENTKLGAWISSQVEEYVGEVDDTLVDFVLNKIRSRSSSKAIIEELKMVLDDDANIFVSEMWRRLHLGALGVDITPLCDEDA